MSLRYGRFFRGTISFINWLVSRIREFLDFSRWFTEPVNTMDGRHWWKEYFNILIEMPFELHADIVLPLSFVVLAAASESLNARV